MSAPAEASVSKIETPASTDQPVSLELVNEVQQFLYRESRLLDHERYRDWLEVLTKDVFYWMPAAENRFRSDPTDPFELGRMAHYEETWEDLGRRILRMETGTAWAEDPRTRHCHVITNIQVERTETSDEFRTFSCFINYRNRAERDEDTLIGHREDILRRVDGRLKLAWRKIVVQQTVLLSKNLNVFL